MYKYYEKKGYKIMEYEFDSITEFLDYLDNTPINDKVWNEYCLSSNTGSYRFTGTNSYEEARELCRFGYHKDFDKLIELKLKLEKYIKISKNKTKQYNYYVGYAPDVKAYLEGNPLSMLNKEMPKREHIDIYFNTSVSCYTTEDQIYNRGAITLSLIETLEKLGYSVGLNLFEMSEEGFQIHYSKFKLKRNDERLNIQKLYFPMCHPSFLRRLIFRLQEETPDVISSWIHGYGCPCDDKKVRNIIELNNKDIVISQPREMGVKGNDIIDDANSMFDCIDKLGGNGFELEQVKVKRLGKY